MTVPAPRVPAPRVPVFICGEPARGDDAAGFAVIELLPLGARDAAEILPVGQLDVLLLLDLPADSACVVVDAVAGITPGEVWVRPLAELVGGAGSSSRGARGATGATTAGAAVPRSSHELPIDQVLALAATMRDAPPAGTFVGIGGVAWGLGDPLSPAVEAGLPALAAAIATAIAALVLPQAGDDGAQRRSSSAKMEASAGRDGGAAGDRR